jgi:hypothetical protein
MAKENKVVCPSQEELPNNEVIWQGTVDGIPCRIVLGFRWRLLHGADAYEATPFYTFELAKERDAMLELRYTEAPKSDIPAEFIQEAAEALRIQKRKVNDG